MLWAKDETATFCVLKLPSSYKLQFLISMLECQQFLFLEAGSDVKAIVLMEDRSLNQMIDIFDDKLVI